MSNVTVPTANTGFGNTSSLVTKAAQKLGLAVPKPGPAEQATNLAAHAKAINAHAEQLDWARDQILELLSRPFG